MRFERLQYCTRGDISLRLVECFYIVLLHRTEVQRKKIRQTDIATNRAGEETPCNVNERDCERRNDRQQLCLALTLVRVYITRARERLRVLREVTSKRFSHHLNSAVSANFSSYSFP